MKNLYKVLVSTLFIATFGFSQTTYVPDDNFEQALINLGYDDTLDDYVLTANISGVTSLDVGEKEISNLTGIEAFTALTTLSCYTNSLTSLDVSANTSLTYLDCAQNQLTSLDVSSNTALTFLGPNQNQLTSLDVSFNTALTDLNCDYNQLTSLDVSNNTALTQLGFIQNQLTSLDVSSNTALTELRCAQNQLTSLDVSANTALTDLHCNDNQLTSLDVSANTALTYLDCNNNQLTSLDVSLNTALTALFCDSNQLDNLDVSANTALIHLQCNDNQLTSLDVSNNIALEIMHCWGNQLTSLDVSSNTALTDFNCSNNQLTSLDVSNNTALTSLSCQNNQLTSLDVSNILGLHHLELDSNQFTSIDVSNNTELITLYCASNALTSLDVSGNTSLRYLRLSHNQLTTLDLSSNIELHDLTVGNNQLTYLNMRNGVTGQLYNFDATGNSGLTCIETLDLDYATANWTSANGNIDDGVTFDVICGAEAQTNWYVATTGSDISGSGTEASPLATIQTAINAASSGDTVSVAAGTYVENVFLENPDGGPYKSISVIGENKNTTIIDGGGTGPTGSGAFIIWRNPNLLLKNFTIQNSATAVSISGADGTSKTAVLENLIVKNNASNGGVWATSSDITIKNSSIEANTSFHGGGVYVTNCIKLTLDDVVIKNNTADYGGGIYVDNTPVDFAGTVSLLNNHASNEGGGIAFNSAANNQLLTNLVIANNTAGSRGAGVVIGNNSFYIKKSTIINNVSNYAAGVFVSHNAVVDIENSIIRDNYPQQLWIDDAGDPCTLSLNYCDIQGGQDSIVTNNNGTVTWGSGNVDVNPMFVDTANGNYHLLASSMLINAGHPDSTDSDGTRSDIGAYPYLNTYSGPTWYVETDGSDTDGTGASSSPFASIQSSINFATTDGDSVTVSEGTYVENLNFRGRNIKVVGGDQETTIIDGGADTTFNDASGVVVFNSGETSAALLDGFTIQNGTSFRGGGLLITASPTIENLIIKNNSALTGGGVHIQTGDPNFNNVDFLNNVSTVDYDGYSLGAQAGGLSVVNGSQSIFTRCTFAGNQSGGYGGGVYAEGSYPDFINVNFYGNNSTQAGGALALHGSTVDVTNSIFWSNNPEQILFQSDGDANSLTVANSDIQGGQDSIVTNNNGTVTWGSGNIDADPHFVDPENGDYHLADWSPCIGTGQDGVDIGAFENALDAPIEHIVITPDTLLVYEDSSATVDFRENDLVLNAIALVLSIIDSSSHGSIILTGDTMLTYTPAADFFGYDTVQYALSGTTAADTGFVFITVVNEDDMPVVVNAIPDITVNEDAPDSLLADLDVVFMDIDDELEYSHVIVDTTLVFASVTNDSVTLQFLPDANGSTDIIFTATNPTIRASVSDTMTVTILPINDAPLMSVITDTTVDEETELEILLTASDVDGDVLTFSATADTSAVIVAVSTDTLSVSLVDNWNGSSILMVVVSDGSATDTTSFELTVNAVNDAPSSFALNEQDSVYITMANFDSDSIVFTWDESADVDEDELTYHFTAELIINGQLTTEYDTTLTANEMKIDYKSVFDKIYAAQAMLAGIEWDVSVSDGIAEVLAENGPLTVGINASDAVLSIDEELLPDVYALHQNYPNPFNPITTLRYDLPEQANVNIIIYDLLGRQVRTLLNQTQDAGYRSVIWNATNDYGKPVSAGVYLYKIQAGEFVQTKKMVLLK